MKWQAQYEGSKDLNPAAGQRVDLELLKSLIDAFGRDGEGLSPSPASLIAQLREWIDTLERRGNATLKYVTYSRLLRWCITDWSKGQNIDYDAAQQGARHLWAALFGSSLPRFRQWNPTDKRYDDDEEDWRRWYSRISGGAS